MCESGVGTGAGGMLFCCCWAEGVGTGLLGAMKLDTGEEEPLTASPSNGLES